MATALPPLAEGAVTDKQHEVYELIRKANGEINSAEIAKALGTSTNNVAQHVRKLRQRGVLPEAAARSNGGQRSTRRAAATTATPPPPPPAPEPEPEPTGDVAYHEIVNDVDAQAAKFIAGAQDRLQGITETLAALDRQREELTKAAVHLEAQIKGLGAAIDDQA